MDKPSQPTELGKCFAALLLTLFVSSPAFAGPPRHTQMTRVAGDVRLVAENAQPRPASVSDIVADRVTIQTGANGSAEAICADQTLVRLGSNTRFSFKKGSRRLDLAEGVAFVQVPKRSRGARLSAAGIGTVVAGTTALLESHPSVFKFLVFDGTGRLYRPGHLGESVLLEAGQMVIGNPKEALSDPVDFDIGRFLKTSRFIAEFSPLRSQASMVAESEKQARAKSKKTLIDTNLVIFGGGTRVSLVNPNPGGQTDAQVSTETPKPAGLSGTATSALDPRPEAFDSARTTKR